VETTIGFVLSERIAAREVVSYGRALEAAGFAQLLLADQFQPFPEPDANISDAWVALAALGQCTSQIQLGASLACPSALCYPPLAAQAFASLGSLYPGRVFLGLDAGGLGHMRPHDDDARARAERLVEAVSIIRRLWQGGPVTHHGRHFHLRNAWLAELPARPVPIYIGAHDAAGMRLAGRHGDGLITDAITALSPAMRSAFAEGAHEMSLDPQRMPILAELVVAVEPGSLLPGAVGSARPAVVSAAPQAHLEAVYALIDAGVQTIIVKAAQLDQRQAIAFYASEVFPHLQQSRELALGV
jgi:F420-dependent hydroxymycolic acid dehydrogenase